MFPECSQMERIGWENDMGKDEARREKAPRLRLSQEQKDRFLEVLGQTGNRRYAAEAIGGEERLMDQRREFDPVLERQREAALDQAHRRGVGAAGPRAPNRGGG